MVNNRVLPLLLGGLLIVLDVRGANTAVKALPAISADAITRVETLPIVAHPVVACTAEELARLRAALASDAASRAPVESVVKAATARLGKPVVFPPRGGQHNSWYQCDRCQIGLKTVDPTHHQCPRCAAVYTGAPYDDVIFSGVHRRNLDDMTDAAWSYALTGDERYAAFARGILLGYAERYRSYPYHDSRQKTGPGSSRSGGHLFEQTLNEATALSGNLAPAYDLVRHAKVFSTEDHAAIRERLLRPMLENLAKHRAGKSNWQTWHNAAMIWGGAVLADAAWVRRAIEDPENGFFAQMKISVSDEGMWYENSWGYHFYTLNALIKTAEAARRLGIDLWSHPVLKQMTVLPVAYAMPDGTLPRFGDDVSTTLDRSARMFEFAYHHYRDERMRPLLPKTRTWDSVMFGRTEYGAVKSPAEPGSALFPGAGHAILRTKGDAGLTAVLTFGPYGGGHGHYDKLSFVLFGHGRELGVDPGRARSQAYRLPIHQHWYKATISHNAVVVDRASQAPAAGKLEAYAANDAWAAVLARCDDAYKGVVHRRLLCVAREYVLVLDELSASQERRFDWFYHNRGSAAVSLLPLQAESREPTYPGVEYIENLRQARTTGRVDVRFPDAAVTTHLVLAAGAETEVRTGDGVGASVLERVPLAMFTRKGKRVHFAAVLEPTRGDAAPTVSGVSVTESSEGTRVVVDRPAGPDVFVVRGVEVEVRSGGRRVLAMSPGSSPPR